MLNVHQLLVALRVMSVVSMYGKENDELPLLAMLEQDTLAPVVMNPPLPLDANSVLLLQVRMEDATPDGISMYIR